MLNCLRSAVACKIKNSPIGMESGCFYAQLGVRNKSCAAYEYLAMKVSEAHFCSLNSQHRTINIDDICLGQGYKTADRAVAAIAVAGRMGHFFDILFFGTQLRKA